MNIAYIVPSLAAKGPVIVVHTLVSQMVENGHTCCVFYLDSSDDEMHFPCATKKVGLFTKADLSGFQIVHSHCIRPNLFCFLHKPWFSSSREKVWITTFHSYIVEEYLSSYTRLLGKLAARLFLLLSSRMDRYVVLSNDALSYYSRWIDVRKLSVAYNGVDPSDIHLLNDSRAVYDEIARFKGEASLVGTYCSLLKIKNLKLLLGAFSNMPETMKMVIIGSGREAASLNEEVRRNRQLAERVLMIPERSDTRMFLPLMDVFAVTSLSEGFCLALVEAAMAKRRIVVADIPGMREKFSDDEVTYFDVNSREQLQKALCDALEDSEKPQKAYRKAMSAFTPQNMYSAYLSIYERSYKAAVHK